MVDYERNYFNVSQANYTSGMPDVRIVRLDPTDLPADGNPEDPDGGGSNDKKTTGLSGGVIAGIAVGALGGIALLAGLVWFFYFKPKRAKRYELDGEGRDGRLSAQPLKGEEIGGNELAELGGGGDGKAEMPGAGAFPVEAESGQKHVHEMPTPVYELPTPFVELETPTGTNELR